MPKRKRSNGFAKAAKRFKARKTHVTRKYRGKKKTVPAKYTIPKPRFFPILADRVRVRHKNNLSWQLSMPASGFTNATARRLAITRLRDADTDVKGQPYPERFLAMARMYQRYRVYGVKLVIAVHGLTNTEDEKFWLCAYDTSHTDGTTDPFNSTNIADRASRDGFLQHPGIRKKMIADSGTTGNRFNTVFRAGYFSVARAEDKRWTDMEDADYAGTVGITGSSVADPAKQPNIWFRVVSPRYSGSVQARTYDINVTAYFDVEWFDKREAIQPTQGETDP